MAGEQADEQQNPETAQEAAPETAAPDPLAGGADALLSMFAHDDAAAQDLTLIVSMSPEVEMDDLLEELHTVAVALGINVREAALAA